MIGVGSASAQATCADQPASVVSTLNWDSNMADCGAVESAGYCAPHIAGSTSLSASTRALVEENCPATCGLCEASASAQPTSRTIAVGGAQGWVVRPGNAAYELITATVGDSLVFTYSPFYHDVMLMDNENCDFSTGQLVDDSGDFAWTIPAPGTYIFACSRGDHCSSGNQQVVVDASDSQADYCAGDVTGGIDRSHFTIFFSWFYYNLFLAWLLKGLHDAV